METEEKKEAPLGWLVWVIAATGMYLVLKSGNKDRDKHKYVGF